jgi:hypothetical protein
VYGRAISDRYIKPSLFEIRRNLFHELVHEGMASHSSMSPLTNWFRPTEYTLLNSCFPSM